MNFTAQINFKAENAEQAQNIFDLMLEAFCNQPETIKLMKSSMESR